MGFKEDLKEKILTVARQYPNAESAILPALHLVQSEYGYIKPEYIEEVASILSLPAAYIHGTAAFYTMFNLKPVGKYRLQICKNISCSLLGAESLVDHLSKKLGIKPGETTKDGLFTIMKVECLGACGGAPVMMVNDKYFENLTADKIDGIIEDLK